MDNKYVKIHTTGCNAPLKVTPGHFATNHAHINYYLDMTTLKTRLSEAQEIARSLSGLFLYDTVVDTIVCLEGTQVVGSFLAEELTSAGVLSMNAHKTIYIVTPEFNSNSQMIFKENILPMIRDKNVIILTASVTTGLALNKGIESIRYYGGNLRAITAISAHWRSSTDSGLHLFSEGRICRIIRIMTTGTALCVSRDGSWMRW